MNLWQLFYKWASFQYTGASHLACTIGRVVTTDPVSSASPALLFPHSWLAWYHQLALMLVRCSCKAHTHTTCACGRWVSTVVCWTEEINLGTRLRGVQLNIRQRSMTMALGGLIPVYMGCVSALGLSIYLSMALYTKLTESLILCVL